VFEDEAKFRAAIEVEVGNLKDMWKRVDALKALTMQMYGLVGWTEPYYRAAGSFLAETLPRLWHLGDPADVRVVFWFDN
jgi:hypothetical protein